MKGSLRQIQRYSRHSKYSDGRTSQPQNQVAGWSALGSRGSQGWGAVTSVLFGKKPAAAFALLPVVDKELWRLEPSLWSTAPHFTSSNGFIVSSGSNSSANLDLRCKGGALMNPPAHVMLSWSVSVQGSVPFPVPHPSHRQSF